MVSKSNILITGKPGVGKTTLIKKLIKGINAGGFWTQEIRDKGKRTGFKLITPDGKKGILADEKIKSPHSPRVGKYGVDISVIDEIGVKSIGEAILSSEIIVIDEIGKMELFSSRFREVVIEALDSTKPLLATITISPHPFVKEIKLREDIEIIELNLKNRDSLLESLRKKLLKS